MGRKGAQFRTNMPRTLPLRPLFWTTLILALPAMGQRPSRSAIGLKIAGQWTTQRVAGSNYQPVPGAAAGVYFPLWCGRRFELQPELLLSFQGTSQQKPENDASTLHMLYLQLPLSAKFYVTNVINAQIGVQGGKLLSANIDGTPVTDHYLPFDFGFVIGLGVDLISGLDLTARYYSGATPVLANDSHDYPMNRVMQLSVGYRIARLSHSMHRRSRG